MKTQDEVEALKANWINEPSWDIEETEGFEGHRAELVAFRQEWEAKSKASFEANVKERIKTLQNEIGLSDLYLHTFAEIEIAVKKQDTYLGDAPSNFEIAKAEIAQAQVRAILLLAAQVKRIADTLDGIVTDEGLMVSALTVGKYDL